MLEAAAITLVTSTIPSLLANEGFKAIVLLLNRFINVDQALEDLELDLFMIVWFGVSRLDTCLLDGHIRGVIESQLDNLTLLCYEAEDLLADMNRNPSSTIQRVRGSLHTQNLRDKLQKISQQFQNLEELRSNIQIETQPLNGFRVHLSPKRPLLGRKAEKKAILEKLISPSCGGVTIVGMHGIGKTMLATSILQDSEVAMHFRTFSDPLTNCTKVFDGSSSYDVIIGAIREELYNAGGNSDPGILNQPYLITIDNLVDADISRWDEFFSEITSERMFGPNLKILVTSTNPEIATVTSTSGYDLKPLSVLDCRQVIFNTALSRDHCLDQPHLSLVVAKLAEKCHGLPLAAMILGLLLGFRGQDKWNAILNRDLWELHDFRKYVIPTLRSSCLNMQPHLKQCLAYLSLFPYTYRYSVDELIQLWVAEGFIPQSRENDVRSVLEMAVNFAKELVSRSILERDDDSANSDGKPSYKLHKFNHELSRLAAACTFLHFEQKKQGNGESSSSATTHPTSYPRVRHLSLLGETIDLAKFKTTRLRTLIAICPATKLPHKFPKNFKRLRVLSLKHTSVDTLPNLIDELENLRCLDISNTRITKLPKKLSNISTLQFLRINGTKISQWPEDFRRLANLVCIDWDVSDIQHFGLPSHIGDLRHLQTLPLFPILDKEGYSIAELKDMESLQGSIRIRNLEKVTTRADAEAANLDNKNHLEELTLEWSGRQTNINATQDILTGLKPHDFLRKLTITNGVFPNWLCDPDRMLETIHLKSCRSGNSVPAIGELQILKTLIVEGVDDLLHIDSKICGNSSATAVHFQSLDSLTLKELSELQSWTELGPADMPKLRELKIISCPELIRMPSLEFLTSLENLQIECCQKLESLPDVPTSLTSLIIKESTLLKDRCFDAGCEDWTKVRNIKNVCIDDQIIIYPTVPGGEHQPIDIQGYQTIIQDNDPAPVSYLNNIVTFAQGLFSTAGG